MPPSTDNPDSEPNQIDPDLIQEQARDWLVRITSGNMSPDEAESFKRWCAQSQLHARTFAETSRTWRLLGAAAELNSDTPVPLPARQLSRRHFLAAAAGVTGVAMVTHFGMRTGISLGTDSSIQTARGEQKRLDISSDIAITLNTLTRVELLNANTSTNEHRVRLVSGEMDVQCSSFAEGFSIFAAGGEITGSDAHINVKHINDSVQVTCLQGLAEVSYQGQRARIGSGEQIRYSPSSFAPPAPVDANHVSAWLNRVLVFDDIPLGEVIEEVNRYRSGKILLLNAQVAKRRVQARFELDRLDEVITLMTDVYGIKSLSLPGGVVVLT
ncbi:MAG: DUF4880 domain-containing protein [Pseudoalteromonas distincta]|uniref:FecR family protein n=1 Tax=Halopseudomonas pelagia TaxID=553151 RepID=UPI0030DD727B|tara:strand:+ start:606 stop:1586 length:981 start_codon:yes stop_codon:yes gene_type:complete